MSSVKSSVTKDKIKVIVRKLGRERALGQAWSSKNLIEIDPRQTEKQFFSTVIHECLHVLFPDLTEKQVIRKEKQLSDVIWRLGYRIKK